MFRQRGLFEGKELKDFIDDNLIEESEGQDKSDNKEFDDRLEDDHDLTEEKWYNSTFREKLITYLVHKND